MTTDTVTIDTRTNIGGTDGTGTIIDTITIMIVIKACRFWRIIPS
jgi:hypothetical protein